MTVIRSDANSEFGAYLKAARVRRGLSLDDVAAETKIPRRLLDAIEHNDVSGWPGAPFSRGFIRSYAAVVGLPPEEAVQRFEAEFGETASPARFVETAGSDASPEPTEQSRLTHLVQWAVLLGLLGIYFAWSGGLLTRQPPAAPRAPAAVAGETPVGTGGRQAIADVAKDEDLVLAIAPAGDCWVSAMVDGQNALERLFHAGDRAELRARHEVVLTVGDAGTFRYTLNDRPTKPLGTGQQVRRATITRDNFRSFLANTVEP